MSSERKRHRPNPDFSAEQFAAIKRVADSHALTVPALIRYIVLRDEQVMKELTRRQRKYARQRPTRRIHVET